MWLAVSQRARADTQTRPLLVGDDEEGVGEEFFVEITRLDVSVLVGLSKPAAYWLQEGACRLFR